MRESHKLLIGAVRQQYLDSIAGLKGSATPQEAFASWVLGPERLAILDIDNATAIASSTSGASRTYREVAVLGYAASLVLGTTSFTPCLTSGLEWIVGRTPFAQAPPSFEVDGVALLGIALGAEATQNVRVKEWIGSFLKRSSETRLAPVDRCLIAAAAALIGHPDLVSLPRESDLSDIRVALSSRGIPNVQLSDDCERAMRRILESQVTSQDAVRSAAGIRVLDWLSYETSLLTKERLTVDDICRLLDRVPASLKRWRWDKEVQWPVENEYHVQDLLWVILAPLFPDLEDEENLPSLGHKHPRCDLGIPSLHLIIEVKFVRKGTQASFANITEEVAADHSLYTSAGSQYDKIIAFIWDDSCSTEQHGELKQGLLKMPGIIGAVIVARPAKMARES